MNRKQYLINPKFQYSFMIYSGAFTLFCLGVFYFSSFYFFSELNQLGVDLKLPEDHIFFKFADLQQRNMTFILGGCTAFIAICQALFGLVYSNKIAGPLYRLTKNLKETKSETPVVPIMTRDKDYFPEVYEAYNHFVSVKNLVKEEEELDKAA